MGQLHVKANAYMDKDAVRPAQALSYEPLLDQVAAILPEVPESAHGSAAGLTPELRNELREVMVKAELPKSHIWVKGLVATYIAHEVSLLEEEQDTE